MAELTIEERLEDLAAAMVDGNGVDLVDAVLARLDPAADVPVELRLRRRGLPSTRWVAAAAVVVLVATVLAVAPARRVVARWVGIEGASVEVVPEVPVVRSGPFDLDPDLGPRTSLADARRRTDFSIRVPSGLGEPDAYVGRPFGGVTLVWPDDQVVITHHRGDVGLMVKQVLPGGVVQDVEVDGHPGYWVTGPDHVIDDDGAGPGAPRRAGNTLAWTVDGITTRIELDGSLAEAQALAASLR